MSDPSSDTELENLQKQVKDLEETAEKFRTELDQVQDYARDLRERFYDINFVLRKLRGDVDTFMTKRETAPKEEDDTSAIPLNTVQHIQPVQTKSEKKSTYTCLVVGDCKSGKTTFLSKLLNGIFIEQYEPTIGMDRYDLTFKVISEDGDDKGEITFCCFDFSGDRDYESIRNDMFKDGECALVLYDGKKASAHDVFAWKREIRKHTTGIPVIPVLNYFQNMEEDGQVNDTIEVSVIGDFNLEAPFVELTKKLWEDKDIMFDLPPPKIPESHEISESTGIKEEIDKLDKFNPTKSGTVVPYTGSTNVWSKLAGSQEWDTSSTESGNQSDKDDKDDKANDSDTEYENDKIIPYATTTTTIFDVDISIIGKDVACDKFYEKVGYGEGNESVYQKFINGKNYTFRVRRETEFPFMSFNDVSKRDFVIVPYDCTNKDYLEDLKSIGKALDEQHQGITFKQVRVIPIALNSDALTREELDEKIIEWEDYHDEDEVCPFADTKPRVAIEEPDYEEIFGEFYHNKAGGSYNLARDAYMKVILYCVETLVD